MNYEPPQKGFRTFLLLTGLGTTTFLVARLGQVAIRSYTLANVTEEPSNVRVSNVGPNSATVSWQTKTPTTAYLRIFNSTDSFEDLSAQIQKNHHLVIEGLQPNTNYQFKIGVGSQLYEGNPTPYVLKTSYNYKPQNTQRVFGQVLEINGAPALNTLIYVRIKDSDNQGTLGWSNPLSSTTNSSGVFSVQLEQALSQDLTSPFYFSPNQDLIEVNALGEKGEMATILLTTNQTQPTPTVQLNAEGKTLDLTNQPKVQGSKIILPLKNSETGNLKSNALKKYLLKILIR